ncbi:MAG: hypothetical protein IPJ34_33825 [Myxococcales bacterium]|nr:hypothetical protein [Myxococcales bacterium]
MRRAPLSVVAGALLACGLGSESDYVEAVVAHVAKGLPSACCTRTGTVGSDCITNARTICGFVEGAQVTSQKVERFGENSGAMVTLEMSGPKGTGVCRYQVLREHGKLIVDGGNCARH